MLPTVEQLLFIARSQLGVAIDTPGVPYATTFSCAKFTSWCYEQVGLTQYEDESPSVQMGIFENGGRFGPTPQPGDQLFIDLTGQGRQALHTGFVDTVNADGTLSTIEFNAPDGGPNTVKYHTRRPVGDGYTLGFGHPDYTADQPAPAPRMRTMYDSTTAADIPADAEIVAGYLNGKYAWSAADWARFPTAQQIGIVIYIPGETPPNVGDVLDIEAGDAPGARDVAAQWVSDRIAAGAHPTIYTSKSTARYFAGLYCTFWLADYYEDGHPHMVSVPGMAVVATQYASPSYGSGGHYDLSLVAPEWHPTTPPVDPPPTPPVVIDIPGDNVKLIKIQVSGTVGGKQVSTDDKGWGNTIVPGVSADRFANAWPNGAGYLELPQFHSTQDEGGQLRINWKGAPLSPPFEAHVLVTD